MAPAEERQPSCLLPAGFPFPFLAPTPNSMKDLHAPRCLASAKLLLLSPALMTANTAQHSTAWHGMARNITAWYGTPWYWAMDAAPCGASRPTSFPLPLPAVAASTSLPESKGKLFLQLYLAGPATNIPRDTKFFLGCSLIICRDVSAVTPPCQGPHAGGGGDHSPHTPSLAWLQVLILNHKRSLQYLPRHPPSPQGWLLTVPGNQSLRPMVFIHIPTTVVYAIAV